MHISKIGVPLIAATTLAVSNATSSPAHAQRGHASPSVRAAARLKYNPPRNWIQHYLGDDRYKILGGTWKVVSTEMDTAYYPPWAPEMLRQPAGSVIGFPSAAAAEEAGYKRSNYPMESPLLGVTQPVAPAAPSGGPPSLSSLFMPQEGAAITANAGAARRVVLSDGASSTVLPRGWTHIKTTRPVPSGNGQTVLIDMFVPGSMSSIAAIKDPMRARPVVFGFMQMPNAEAMFSGRPLRQIGTAMERRGRVDTRLNALRAAMPPASFGNMRGVRMSVPVPQYGTLPMVFAARGSKVTILADLSRRAAGSQQITASFRGR
jgi:hypothetical protein